MLCAKPVAMPFPNRPRLVVLPVRAGLGDGIEQPRLDGDSQHDPPPAVVAEHVASSEHPFRVPRMTTGWCALGT
jgi:hypothetical protein